MADSATFLESVGGDGSTVTGDANPTTGLANGGHRKRFVNALAQVVAVASNTVTKATEAVASSEAASNWATKTDGPVSGGEYSAKYHAAAAAVSAAAAQAVVLNGAAIVPTWLTGTTWALGQIVLSGINGKTYRKITATSLTTTDPASDATNWAALPVPAQTAAQTEFTPIGGVFATNVQAAIAELDTEKIPYPSGSFGTAGQVLTSAGGSSPPVWAAPTVQATTPSLKNAYLASGSFVVPAGKTSIRGYAVGAGANGSGSSGGGGGGFAFGDVPVTAGETLTIDITSGVAKLMRGTTELLRANAASGPTGGTATKHASVTNGGAYSGGTCPAQAGGGGASAGSPLGSGYGGGFSAGNGGAGIGGTGGSSGGGGGGAGGAGSGLNGGGAGEAASSQKVGKGRQLAYLFADPLLSSATASGGVGFSQLTGAPVGESAGCGGGGGGVSNSNAAIACSGGNGGDFGGGGGCQATLAGSSPRGGDGGFLGGGGGAYGNLTTSTCVAGNGGIGGGGGSAYGQTVTHGTGGAACVLLYY